MKKFLGVAIALAIFSSSQSANAANNVWFEAGASGAEGSVLELVVDTSGGPADQTFAVSMLINNSAATAADGDALVGWALDLIGGNANFSISDVNVNVGPFNQSGGPGVAGAGPNLWVGGNRANFFGATSGTSTHATFNLNVSLPAGDLSVTEISARIGQNEWAQVDFLDPIPTVSVAGNPAVLGGAGNDAGVAIRVTAIPEPATVSLLVIGALALVRRRKA